jgi:hypothetical protein
MKYFCVAVIAAMVAMPASAEEKTLTGKISDSRCGARHASAGEHGGTKMPDRDCTLGCVRDHAAKYVFVSDGKVYDVSNQDFAALPEHAGHTVELTGDMSGDTIAVSKIVMPDKKSD